jgi:hypothetical protein
MEYDFAIVYWGLTRSSKKVYNSHIEKIYNVLETNGLTYKKFMHTWKTNNDLQRVWENIIPQKIDYNEYKCLSPDFYNIDNQDDFINNVNMDCFFYKDVFDKIGSGRNGEWLPGLITNHICALESMKRCVNMLEYSMSQGNKYKHILFIRPDVLFHDELPINDILLNIDKINIPNNDNNEGYNDRFAVMNYKNACIYGKRINELEEFRKTNGRIVSEKYLKYIINKYDIKINPIKIRFDIIRP